MTEEEKKAKAEAEAKEAALSQNAIKLELEKEQNKKNFTEKEKASFNLRKQAERAKELGIDPNEVLGIEPKPQDDVPEWYKKEQAKNSQKTAFEIADGISDADEKALVREYLSTRIVPSGNPQDDFKLAYSAVNALKNKQILEEVNRRVQPKITAAGGSSNSTIEPEFVPTSEEMVFMKPPYNVKKDKIIEARKKTQDKQK